MHVRENTSKLGLAESFVDLVEKMPLDKITISMITETAHKHRKTFYYHFLDKTELIVWIFRYDLAKGLRREFPGGVLIWEEPNKNNLFIDFPYYVRNINQDKHIINARFFEVFAQSLEVRKTYYRKVFAQLGRGTLEDYIYNLYWPAIRDDIHYLIDLYLTQRAQINLTQAARCLKKETPIEFLAEFYAGAFVLRVIKRLNQTEIIRTLDDIKPFDNVIHDSLYLLFENANFDRRT